jgi:hypothetical protein
VILLEVECFFPHLEIQSENKIMEFRITEEVKIQKDVFIFVNC